VIFTKIIAIFDDGTSLAGDCYDLLTKAGYAATIVSPGSKGIVGASHPFALSIISEKFLDSQQTNSRQKQIGRDEQLPFILLSDGKNGPAMIAAVNKGAVKICSLPLVKESFLLTVESALLQVSSKEEIVRLNTLMSLYELSKRFFLADSEQAVCDGLVEIVEEVIGCSRVSTMLYDEACSSLKIVSQKGLQSQIPPSVQLKPGERIAGKVFLSGKAAILNRAEKMQSPFQALMQQQETCAAISFPLQGRKGTIGVINISEIKDNAYFGEADLELLSIITAQAVLALENIRNITKREEKNRMAKQLEQYVSQEISQLLAADNYDLMNAGEVTELTVLFADIRHFTELVQHLQPWLLRQFLNTYFESFSSIIFSQQGMIDKFMGDGALVVFGAPIAVDNPEDRAVLAARRIMRGFAELRDHWQKDYEVFARIGLGIGVAKGPMFLGNIGSARRLDYTVIGMDVNIAQRLASETVAGQILATDAVVRSLSIPHTAKTAHTMRLRGIYEQVMVYNLF
jgi:adenylate cyclase